MPLTSSELKRVQIANHSWIELYPKKEVVHADLSHMLVDCSSRKPSYFLFKYTNPLFLPYPKL